MRTISLGLFLLLTPLAAGQIKEERRFGIRYDVDLYPQATPRQTLGSLLRAIDKDRYDYLVAFLLDPAYVKEQLEITAPYFEKVAREKVEGEGLDKKGFEKVFIRNRMRDLALTANVENLARRVKDKLAEDPETVKELRKLFRAGEVGPGMETSTLKHPDIKGRSLFFRNMDGRWYIENKMQE